MFNRKVILTTILMIASLVFQTSFAVAAETNSDEVPLECKNYTSKVAQKKRKIAQYQRSCTAYQTKVTAAESKIAADQKALTAADLTKRQISRLNNVLKSHKKTLATQKKYATGYCNTVNDLQEEFAGYEKRCKPKTEQPTNSDNITKVVRAKTCEGSGIMETCSTIDFEGDTCVILYDNTYYNQDYFADGYRIYSQPGYTITFPAAGGNAQVGLVFKIVARHVEPNSYCKQYQ